MKVVLSEEHFLLLSRWGRHWGKEPASIYGVVREKEEQVNIFQIGGEPSIIPKIGEVVKGPLPQPGKYNHLIAAVVEDREVAMFFKKRGRWVSTELDIIGYGGIYKRTPFAPRLREVLWGSCVLIFGLGTGGSEIALELARAGVGHMKLVDPSPFHIENVSRHECGLLDLGRYKVHGVAEKIKLVNPKIKAETFPFDAFDEGCPVSLDSLFENVDLVIGATDKTSIQLRINAEARARGIPALFGGCYEEARGGEVFYTLPGEGTPCLECLRGGLTQPETTGEIDYSLAEGYEDYKGEPGLHASVSLVTNIEVIYALALLLRNEDCELARLIDPARNFILIGGALGAGFYLFKRPFHIFFPKLSGPRKGCSVCQKEEQTDAERKEIEEDIKKFKEVPPDLHEFL